MDVYFVRNGAVFSREAHRKRNRDAGGNAPVKRWPAWARFVRRFLSSNNDRGVGDTIERTIGPIGGDKFKRWFKSMTGKPCGCSIRRDAINLRFPYQKPA